MFSYDSALLAAVQQTPQTIADVVQLLESIQNICADGDGLKWFNGLYLDVTRAVQARVGAAGFGDPEWIAVLDVRFAGFYFAAVQGALTAEALPGSGAPGCWQALFNVRNQAPIARIQFALAGMNAHINHDLPQAVVDVCQATSIEPQHESTQYNDYTALNATLDSLIDAAKKNLHVRLLGGSAFGPGESAERIHFFQHLRRDGDIGHDFTVRDQGWVGLVKKFHRFADFLALRMPGAAEA